MEKKLAEYRAQKSKEYQAGKTSTGDSVIQKGWQFLKSWRGNPVSIFVKESKANYITAQKRLKPNWVTLIPWRFSNNSVAQKNQNSPRYRLLS